jgi:threonine synthase
MIPGNAGASFAAYAAHAGIRARIFVPEDVSSRKTAQIAACGAAVVLIPGPRSKTARAVREEALRGAAYASHAWIPLGLAGMATLAFEVVEQLGQAPGAVVLPVGHGTLLLGIERGFAAMHLAGAIDRRPQSRLRLAPALRCGPSIREAVRRWPVSRDDLAEASASFSPARDAACDRAR